MKAPIPRCLLLVEDDELVRETVAAMLEDEGYDVVEASNASAALALVRNGLDVPLIVTDVDLGVGPNGAELADMLRRLRPDYDPKKDPNLARPSPFGGGGSGDGSPILILAGVAGGLVYLRSRK